MTNELIDLARRAVACKHWRWMPGMRTIEVPLPPPWALPQWDEAVVITSDDGDPVTVCTVHRTVRDLHPGALPDLSNPATLGCLLALVREAWRCPTAYVRRSDVRRTSDNEYAWEVCDLWLDEEACRALGLTRQGSVGCWGHKSEAEALVFALVNAPQAPASNDKEK